MTYKDIDPPNWRNDPGMTSIVEYRRKFAFLPIICADNTKVHFAYYYKKYKKWNSDHYGSEYSHTDFIENITEAEYMVRKLAETL